MGTNLPPLRNRATNAQGMAEGNAEDRQDSEINLTSQIPHPVHPETVWMRASTMCGLLSPQPYHHSQPLPPSSNAGAAGPGSGHKVVY